MYDVTLNDEWIGEMGYDELIDIIVRLRSDDKLEIKKIGAEI